MEPHNADGGAGGPGKNSIVSNEGCGGSEQPPGSPIVMAKKSSGFVPPPHLDLDNEAPPPPPTADGEARNGLASLLKTLCRMNCRTLRKQNSLLSTNTWLAGSRVSLDLSRMAGTCGTL